MGGGVFRSLWLTKIWDITEYKSCGKQADGVYLNFKHTYKWINR